MEIRQLRYFVSIVEARSFTRAAEKLLISQPAVGLQIRNLERELGVSLLVRHSRGVELTDEGEILMRRARAVLAEVDGIAQAIRNCAGEARGTVRLGLAPSLSVLLAEPLMRLATERLPKVDLQLIEVTSPLLRQWVATRAIDMAIGCEGGSHDEVEEHPVLGEAMYLVGAPERFQPGQETIPFRALEGRRLLLADPMRSGVMEAKVRTAALVTGSDVRIAELHPSVETVKLLVQDGKGDTILPWSSVRRDCQQGALTAARIVEPDLLRHAVHFRRGNESPSLAHNEVGKLIDMVIRDAREMAPPCALVDCHAMAA